jgi:hypothetical protein
MMIIRALGISLGLGILTVLATMVPFLSMLIGLIAFPILSAPPFDATGAHATYGFAWIEIESASLWALLIAYFTVLYFLPVYFWMRRRRSKGEIQDMP